MARHAHKESLKSATRVEEPAVAYASPLGIHSHHSVGLAARVAAGIGYGALAKLLRETGMPLAEVTDWMQITPRTLARRKESGKLSPDESDRLLRVARIFGLAADLFEGDKAAALRWLRAPRAALGDSTPIDLSKSEVGAREVEALIGRLEHGVIT